MEKFDLFGKVIQPKTWVCNLCAFYLTSTLLAAIEMNKANQEKTLIEPSEAAPIPSF